MPSKFTVSSTDYERHVAQSQSASMKLQSLATSLILAVTSPFALPILFLRIRHLDEGTGASFENIVSAAYLLTLGTYAIIAHARSVVNSKNDVPQAQATLSSYISSRTTIVKRHYVDYVSTASGYLNAACASIFVAAIATLLFEFYPIGTVALFGIAGTTIVFDAISSKFKPGTLFKENAFSAVSNLRGAVSENEIGGLIPAL